MPELPEVETVARQLDQALPGRKIIDLLVLDHKLGHLLASLPTLRGAAFKRVRRLGKQVVLELDGTGHRPTWMLVHLRMTGRLLVLDQAQELPRHARFTISMDRGHLCFADSRRFGTALLTTQESDMRAPGLDPFEAACTPVQLQHLAQHSSSPIKLWLLDQHKVTGLGNIYACEILHAAGLSPHRRANSLGSDDWKRLHREMRRILRRAIDLCGTTFSDFQDSRGVEGSFGKLLRVYGRHGEACPRCGALVQRETQAQRGSWWCQGCQH